MLHNPESRLKPRSGQDRSVKTRIHARTTDKGSQNGRIYSLISRHNKKKRELRKCIDSTPTDDFTAAEFLWKQLQEPIKISRLQEIKASGPQAKLQYVAEKMKHAERNIRENLALGLFSDGGATTGALSTDQLSGLQLTMSASSTYGGIAVAELLAA